ncbi:MAG: ABC transporter ATP-binding protein [Janthinobacterium lividum]
MALRLDNVEVTFAGRGGGAYTAVADTTLHVAEGEFVSVVGPTGCGKSTLLNLAAGLLAPTRGTVTVQGRPLAGLNRQAGYLFQTESLMPWRSARDNVAAGPEFHGASRAQARAQADGWLDRVGLRGHGAKYPHQMSGGMRKRAQLAQTLVLDPPILLMDEPFSALDVQTRLMMENELLAIWQANRKSVLFITHDLEEAISLSDRVVVLSAGPGTRPIAEFPIDLPRPRDVAEIRMTPAFQALQEKIWAVLRDEVVKAYQTGRAA